MSDRFFEHPVPELVIDLFKIRQATAVVRAGDEVPFHHNPLIRRASCDAADDYEECFHADLSILRFR